MTSSNAVWSMFLHADWVVQGVMILLVLASIASWTICVAKIWEFRQHRQILRHGLAVLRQTSSLLALESLPGLPGLCVQQARLDTRDADTLSHKGIKSRTTSALDDLVAQYGRSLGYGTGMLASIGSTGPFIGLFGTVWGIMNSFIGIAHSKTTNLAVVAPGIAEALLATGMGLIAAIPAVLIYNAFTRMIGSLRAEAALVASQILRLQSRDLDTQTLAGNPPCP